MSGIAVVDASALAALVFFEPNASVAIVSPTVSSSRRAFWPTN